MLDNYTKCLDMDCVRKSSEDLADNVSAGAQRAREAVEDFVREDLLVRAQSASDAVTKALAPSGVVAQKVTKASEGVKSVMATKKNCPIKKPWLATFAAAAGLAVAGYIVWSRTRPVEDPWAEESWEDIDDEDLVVVAE